MSSTEVCFNSNCKEVSDKWRRGWRRRTGEYANLCDRCASAYEDGKFCETFHLNASGWRCCESCGKQIHCGCIVSFHMFVLLDAGGIECLTCAKKSYILTPNPAWPPPSHFLPSQPERMKDLSVKTWGAVAGSGPVPWRQAPSLFSGSDIPSNVQPRLPFEVDVSGSTDRYRISERLSNASPGSTDRYRISERLSNASPEMKQECSYERLVNGKLRLGPADTLQNGNTGLGMKEHSYSFGNGFKPLFQKSDYSSSNLNLSTASSSKIEADKTQLSAHLSQPPGVSIPVDKQVSHGGVDPSAEAQTRNGKARGDGRSRNQLLPRYRPQITDEELQKISNDSKSVIIPLFEKMLSASDAGRIGRLVLPKKCAEAYFPAISQPEGLPLKVQDVKGKEWVFQFRFWPNNNSRMYVLEGITPCIQSMQLQAGDVVTFSRMYPEGKLVMGGRKASAISSSDQGDEVTVLGTDALAPGDGSARHKSGDVISSNGHMKDKMHEDKPFIYGKRKNSICGVKSKRLRIENEDMIELKITWKEAQGLMRPPAKIVPSFFVVEGCEFEEFEEAAPVIGRPTIPGVDLFGEKVQWVQCEDCFKWRKVPAHALLSSRWVCSENAWDPDRSLCSAPEELTKEQLEDMLPPVNKDPSKEEEITEQGMDPSAALEGLDTLANLAILGEGEDLASSENRTKHPRHKPGCTCIVCLQPPSGKGSKHDQSCDCVLCSSLKRRFRTLMERREKKQLGKEVESSSQNMDWQPISENMQSTDMCPDTNAGDCNLNHEEAGKWSYLDELNGRKPSTSPLKGQIDLNIQPDREEELSPSSLPGSSDKFFRQPRSLGAEVIENLVGKEMQQDGIGGANFINCMALDGSNQKTG